jgi:hypothetical protein
LGVGVPDVHSVVFAGAHELVAVRRERPRWDATWVWMTSSTTHPRRRRAGPAAEQVRRDAAGIRSPAEVGLLVRIVSCRQLPFDRGICSSAPRGPQLVCRHPTSEPPFDAEKRQNPRRESTTNIPAGPGRRWRGRHASGAKASRPQLDAVARSPWIVRRGWWVGRGSCSQLPSFSQGTVDVGAGGATAGGGCHGAVPPVLLRA